VPELKQVERRGRDMKKAGEGEFEPNLSPRGAGAGGEEGGWSREWANESVERKNSRAKAIGGEGALPGRKVHYQPGPARGGDAFFSLQRHALKKVRKAADSIGDGG